MPPLKPFFSFYGAKWRIAGRYPAPAHDTVVEPFAGSAGYAVRHHARRVILNDADPIIFGVWDFLIRATPAEVLALPAAVDHVDDVPACQEARWLIGFWLNKGSAQPKKQLSKWARTNYGKSETMAYWGSQVRDRIASQVDAIKHWRVTNADFAAAPPAAAATYFVDPPYAGKPGDYYRVRFTRHAELGQWCRTNPGQVIACERAGADWLPFADLGSFKAAEGKHKAAKRSEEAVWLSPAAAARADSSPATESPP